MIATPRASGAASGASRASLAAGSLAIGRNGVAVGASCACASLTAKPPTIAAAATQPNNRIFKSSVMSNSLGVDTTLVEIQELRGEMVGGQAGGDPGKRACSFVPKQLPRLGLGRTPAAPGRSQD